MLRAIRWCLVTGCGQKCLWSNRGNFPPRKDTVKDELDDFNLHRFSLGCTNIAAYIDHGNFAQTGRQAESIKGTVMFDLSPQEIPRKHRSYRGKKLYTLELRSDPHAGSLRSVHCSLSTSLDRISLSALHVVKHHDEMYCE